MDKLIFKTLVSNDEIDLVLNKVERYSGVRLPIVYAKNSKIVGVFLHNNLVACYMLVTRPGFRSIMFLPDNIRSSVELSSIDEFEMMEVNGLWIGPALKTPILQIRVWLQLVKDIFMCKKRFVLLMRDSRNSCMERFFDMANPRKLYSGQPFQSAENSTHASIEVSYTTRWKIVLNIHKYLRELADRQKRAKRGQIQRANGAYLKAS